MRLSAIVLAYFSLFALGICDNLRGPLYPEILRDFSFADGQGAWFYALNSVGVAIGSFSTRRLLKYWDRVQVLRFGLLLLIAALVATALAQGPAIMLAVWFVFGVSLGLLAVPQNVLASVNSTPESRPRVMAGLHSMYGIASLLAPLVAVAFASPDGNWRRPFFVLTIVPISVLLYSQWKIPREPAGPDEKRTEGERVPGRERIFHFWWAFILGCYVLCETMVSSRLALYFRREQGADLALSGTAVTAFFAALLGGRLLAVVWKNPFSLIRQLQFALATTAVLVVVGLLWWPWALAMSGFFMGPFYPVGVAYMTGRFRRHVDSAMAVAAGFQSVLGVGMHLAVGELSDRAGLTAALFVGPTMVLVGLGLLAAFDRQTRELAL